MGSKIDELLAIACSKGASDLHIKAGSFPFMRVNGELLPIIESSRLTAEDTLSMAVSIMNNRQKKRFNEWRATMPPFARERVAQPVLLATNRPGPVPFSRLTLTAQLEILARPVYES